MLGGAPSRHPVGEINKVDARAHFFMCRPFAKIRASQHWETVLKFAGILEVAGLFV